MTAAVLVLTGLAASMALLLRWASQRLAADDDPVVEAVDALLPQSQCAQCGYPGCRPYAAAIVRGEAPINRCVPGGEATVQALSRLLETDVLALDERYGKPGPAGLAVIDESLCIGCARCLDACPVDAILGAPRFMHTVLSDQCTGCELCVAPCPVDCIRMVPADHSP